MNNRLKAALYLILSAGVCLSGYFCMVNFRQMLGGKNAPAPQAETAAKPGQAPGKGKPDGKDQAAQSQTVRDADTNAPANTNAVATVTNQVATNIVAGATNAPATNEVAATETEVPNALGGTNRPEGYGRTHTGLWLGVFILSVAGLGIMIAFEISNYAGNRALKVLYNDEGEGMKDPEYDQAEQVWADGNHLEAVRLMREYLNKNPREQHVALRIAEIYEKDLQNNLAAALEYEEVLKHKLESSRWGWAAIHLCNLYFKLDREQKAYDLLKRIVREHGDTPAAEKARKRLTEVGQLPMDENQPEPEEPKSSAKPAKAKADDGPGPASNLPPGFRPKR